MTAAGKIPSSLFLFIVATSLPWVMPPATANVKPADVTAPAFPDTPAGRTAKAYVDAFNSGDEKQMREFESKHRSKAALAKRPMDERIKQWQELRTQWGKLEVRKVLGDQRINLIVHATASDEYLDMGFELEAAEPYGLEGIRIAVMNEEPSEVSLQPLDAAARKQAVESIASTLDRVYVFPEVGKKMADLIRKRAADGAYDKITEPQEFAQQVREDLRSVCPDKHLGFRVGTAPKPHEGGDPDPEGLERHGARNNYSFEKTEVLPGNIGYVKFNMFVPGKAAEQAAAAAMNPLAGCDALIFDIRENGGGYPEMIAFLSGYVLDKKTHLNSFYNRETGDTEEWHSRDDVPGPRFGGTKPVYVLTSGHTFSGAEEFTYNLKNLKRATIIGETTGGGAHPVNGHDIAGRFTLMVPFARAINPITKTNWEGVGVEPDVKVPAADALDTALKAAKDQIGKGKP